MRLIVNIYRVTLFFIAAPFGIAFLLIAVLAMGTREAARMAREMGFLR